MTRFTQDFWTHPTPNTGRFELHPVAGWQWAEGQDNIIREGADWIEHPVVLWFALESNKNELIEWDRGHRG